jgi:hypothetical protein
VVSDFPSFSLPVMTPSAANADVPYHLFLLRDSIILMLRVRQKSVARPRIRTAEYWREYYTRKQREWRAAHPRLEQGENNETKSRTLAKRDG